MKVLFISTMAGNQWGGSEELWVRSAGYALSCGHEVHVSVFNWGQLHPKIEALREQGAKLHLRTRTFMGHSTPQRAMGKLRSILFSAKQIRKLARLKPNAIFISQGTVYECMFPQFLELLNSTGAKTYIITQANSEYNTIPKNCFTVGRQLFAAAEQLYFVSDRNRQVAERQLAMRFNNASVISNPFNLQSYDSCSWNNSNTVHFAAVGRLNATVKGLPVMLEVLSQPQWKDRDWKFQLYGKGPDEQYLKELVTLYKLENKVFLRGFVNNIQAVWEENHVLLMASTLEGTPLALIEAMLCGRTAMVTDVGGNAEMINDEFNGFVAEAPSVNSISKAMERLWKEKELLQELGKRARKSALEKVDVNAWKKIIDQLEIKNTNSIPVPATGA